MKTVLLMLPLLMAQQQKQMRLILQMELKMPIV